MENADVALGDERPGRPFRPLATTLIRSIVIAATLCTLLVVAVQLVVSYHAQHAHFEAEVQSIVRTNIPLLSVNLWDIEPEAVRRQMKLIVERPQIAHAVLEAATGQEFSSGDLSTAFASEAITLDVPYPADRPGRLGTLRIMPNVEYLYRQLAVDALWVLASALVLTTLTCVVITVILRRQLQLPMQRIAAFAASLSPGTSRPLKLLRPNRRWRDEIDEVADGFRVLQDDIRTHVEELDRQVAQRTAELEQANAWLERLSRRDPLTGLANRRHFEQDRLRAWAEMLSQSHPLSVLMVDIDYFKHYNDTYGHAAGDECLVTVARALATSFERPGELPVRMGGEEFAVLLDNAALGEAIARAESFRARIFDLGLEHANSAYERITVSIGVSSVDPRDLPASIARATALHGTAEMLGRADQALYEAKAAGRNRVIGIALAATAISAAEPQLAS